MNDDNAEEILCFLASAREYLNDVVNHEAFHELNVCTRSTLESLYIDLGYIHDELCDDINVELS